MRFLTPFFVFWAFFFIILLGYKHWLNWSVMKSVLMAAAFAAVAMVATALVASAVIYLAA